MAKKALFHRKQLKTLLTRLRGQRKFIQVLAGPRQTGKTTIALQLAESLNGRVHYASADEPALRGSSWIEQEWNTARSKSVTLGNDPIVLILDEIQKLPGWSETVKRLWDADTVDHIPVNVVLLGSAPLLVQEGLTESLAGRFEIIPVPHWSFAEMHQAFGWTLDEYIFYGGYPGSADLIDNPQRWARYIIDALVEPTIARDILLMTRVDKPALLRQLFLIGTSYAGQIVSFQKLTGQLQDAGNTTTLAHYLQLLQGAGLLAGLQKFSGSHIRQRASSPKLIVLNNALLSSQSDLTFEETRERPEVWGRLVESAVGGHFINSAMGTDLKVLYWREGQSEVDFILQKGRKLVAVEVKSGGKHEHVPGMDLFARRYHHGRLLLIGKGGIPISEFFRSGPEDWLG